MTLNNWKMIAETRSYILKWRSRFRRRRVCLSSLVYWGRHDVDRSKNVIWKCNFAFLQSFSIIEIIVLEKCVLTILELNWNKRLEHKTTKLNICHHMLTSSTQLQNRSPRRKNENVFKMSKDEKCTCRACKHTVFHCQICKFMGFLLPSSSWLLELPTPSFSSHLWLQIKRKRKLLSVEQRRGLVTKIFSQ